MARATAAHHVNRLSTVPNAVPDSTSTACASEMPLPDGKLREAPSVADALAVLKDLRELLHPHRKSGKGHVDPGLDQFVRLRMETMQTMFNFYTSPLSKTHGFWGASSLQAAVSLRRGTYCSRQLRTLVRAFIVNRTVLPLNPYGYWTTSMLVDEELNSEINLYLQELRKNITAAKRVEFLARPDIMQKHSISRTISIRTAECYLLWMHAKKGQYADGHERPDVIAYQKDKFLPSWRRIWMRMDMWSRDNLPEFGPNLEGKRTVVWFHNESIFYVHDRRRKTWYRKDAPAKPYAKGEGASLIVVDFVSSKYGWLHSPDGTRSARVVMKPGKNKDGYFTNVEICKQVKWATFLHSQY
ncbi:hypothetical protein C8R44DRAFT_647193 [Mycena epipterygia]|nr:hypothetical protein C8R44DRAFT_647193 [Mycena epipterygia]